MAAAAFILGSILGILGGIFAYVFMGAGVLAAFGIYLACGTLLPLTALLVTDTDRAPPEPASEPLRT